MIYRAFLLSCLAESNRRPPPYQGDALPTELHQQFRCTNLTKSILSWWHMFVNWILLNFSKNTNNYRILFSQNKCCVIMAGYVKCMFHLLCRNFTRSKVCVHKLSYIWLCAKILRVHKNKKEDHMFFWKKQSKRKKNLSRKIMAFVLAGVLLLSSVGMNVSAQEIVTKKSTI